MDREVYRRIRSNYMRIKSNYKRNMCLFWKRSKTEEEDREVQK